MYGENKWAYMEPGRQWKSVYKEVLNFVMKLLVPANFWTTPR